MSLEVTSRLTGGAYLIPLRMWTVTVLPSDETSGAPVARSGRASVSSAPNEYSVRLTAYWTW